jgi:hypothetical protein
MAYLYFRNFVEVLEQAGGLKRVALTLGIAATALFFTSCGTPGTRISQHPDIYQGLSSRDQALVSQGQIRLGMSMDAVWLAWGTPEQKVPGYGRGRPTETWVYLRIHPAKVPIPLQRSHFRQRQSCLLPPFAVAAAIGS